MLLDAAFQSKKFAAKIQLRIRDVSGLLCALGTEGGLNEKLRAAGQKPFHQRTIQDAVGEKDFSKAPGSRNGCPYQSPKWADVNTCTAVGRSQNWKGF